MDRSIFEALRGMRIGLVLAMLGVLFGFGMGVAFGAFEGQLKAGLRADADAVLTTVYGGDRAKADAVLDKSFAYFQRAHLHGGAIGAVALGLILVLACTQASRPWSALAALGLGGGSLGYPLFWLLAGMRAPGLGGTGAAKESLEWLAVSTSGMAVAGLVVAIGATAMALFGAREK